MHSLLSHCPKAAKYIRQNSGCRHDAMILVKSRFMKVSCTGGFGFPFLLSKQMVCLSRTHHLFALNASCVNSEYIIRNLAL